MTRGIFVFVCFFAKKKSKNTVGKNLLFQSKFLTTTNRYCENPKYRNKGSDPHQ